MFLSRIDPFRAMPEPKLAQIAGDFIRMEFRAGEIIHNDGEQTVAAYLIFEGHGEPEPFRC